MAQMAAAAPAMNLGAAHEEAAIGMGLDRVVERRPEARPAGAAVEFGLGREQRLAAAGAMIDAGPVLLVERAGAGALGAVLPQHAVLLRGQLLAPLGVAERHLEFLGGRLPASAQPA